MSLAKHTRELHIYVRGRYANGHGFRALTTPADNRRLSVWSRGSGEPTGFKVKRGPIGPVTMSISKLPWVKCQLLRPTLRQFSAAMSRDPETASFKASIFVALCELRE